MKESSKTNAITATDKHKVDVRTSTKLLFSVRGENLPLRFKTSSMDVEVKDKPAGNELLVPEPVIQLRTVDGKLVQKVRTVAKKTFYWHGKNLSVEIKLIDPESQKEVPLSEALEVLDNYQYKYVDNEGNILKEADCLYYAMQQDGSEKEVSPFDRTQVLDIPDENWVPSTSIDGFLITNIYEVYSDDPKIARALFEEAEKRLKADKIGITTFSHGRGFKQYYAFLCPLFKDGKFVWLMKLTDQKLAYNHMQEPPVAAKVPIREAPTLQTLPPVQALVVTTKKKK